MLIRMACLRACFLFATLLLVVLTAGSGGSASGADLDPGAYMMGLSAERPPTVSSISPANNAKGVSLDTKITATFSKDMDASTITIGTFTLTNGTTPVSGTVTYAAKVATFTPGDNLEPNTKYTATITTGVRDVSGHALACARVWSFTTLVPPDTTAPTVISTCPVNGATCVALSAKVTATFSEAMNPSTINTNTFTLYDGTSFVSGRVTYANGTATFTPSAKLAPTTTFTATITTGATDKAGNALAAAYVWTFTTCTPPDTTKPKVIATNPTDHAWGVFVWSPITAVFSEPMQGTTINTTTFTVKKGTKAVCGTVTYENGVATFTPDANLEHSTIYTCRITTGVKDLAGNALAAVYVWCFTTGSTCSDDHTAPTVSSTSPANGATSVGINTAITATFSEAMKPSTINSTTFTLMQGATPVAGTVTYVGGNAVFTPAAALTPNTTYTATLTTGVTDLAGNALTTPYVWSFTTGATPDTTAPTVSSTVPTNGATNVPVNTAVSATFDEAMNPLTINTSTFTLMQGATPVAGTVTYAGVTATFVPAVTLAPNTTYTGTITTGATDLAGNALTTPYVWSFTTGAIPDTTAPTVTSTVPTNGATNVPVNTAVSATFDEAMNPATINTATFTLAQGATPITGTVTYAGVTATFTPAASLAPSTTYTATITTGAQDLAGNALASPYVWSFTTGAIPDTTAPTVISTVPTNGATNVPVNTAVSATFSEAMNPLTINTSTFTLAQGVTPVAGTVTYAGVTGTFTPAASLAPNTTYTATITTGAQDLAGNALASPYVWSFTTGAIPDTTAPTVISTVPTNGATNVPVGTTVTATFSEAMNPLTINTSTFTLAQGVTPVTGTVTYSGVTATFTPAASLASNTTYTATITTGAQDLAGNALAANYVWTFKTGEAPILLGSDALYAVLAGTTITNTALVTTINGNLGLSPGTSVTGFPPGIVNGATNIANAAAAQAKVDLTAAYNDALGRTSGAITVSGDLGGQTLTPGLYNSTSSLAISSGDLTLDAQGDPNAVFIFQMGSTLTVANNRQIILTGGASAANIYWQVGSSATLGTTSVFEGTILAATSITAQTGAIVNGRLLAQTGAVTLDGNTVTAP